MARRNYYAGEFYQEGPCCRCNLVFHVFDSRSDRDAWVARMMDDESEWPPSLMEVSALDAKEARWFAPDYFDKFNYSGWHLVGVLHHNHAEFSDDLDKPSDDLDAPFRSDAYCSDTFTDFDGCREYIRTALGDYANQFHINSIADAVFCYDKDRHVFVCVVDEMQFWKAVMSFEVWE